MDDDVLMRTTADDALSPRQVRRKAHLLRHEAHLLAMAEADVRMATRKASLVSPPSDVPTPSSPSPSENIPTPSSPSENVPTPENVPAPAVVSETIQQSDNQLSEMASCGPIIKLVNSHIVDGGLSNRAPESTTTRCPSDVLDDCTGGHLEFSTRCQFCGLSWSLVLVLPAGYSFCRPASQFYHARSALDSAFDRFMSSAERGGLT